MPRAGPSRRGRHAILGHHCRRAHETKNTAHIGHEKAEVKADQKAFPDKDGDLVAKGDATTGLELLEWLTTLTDVHFAVRQAKTLADLEARVRASRSA